MANEAMIIRAIRELTGEIRRQNKMLKEVADAIERKQFDDWVAPPVGTVYMNSRGCVMMSKLDYNNLTSEEREDTDGRG